MRLAVSKRPGMWPASGVFLVARETEPGLCNLATAGVYGPARDIPPPRIDGRVAEDAQDVETDPGELEEELEEPEDIDEADLEDLEDEDLLVDDDDALVDDEALPDDEAEVVEVPVATVPDEDDDDDEDEEPEPDEIEATLDEILKERLVVTDEEDEAEEDETPDTDERADSLTKVLPKQPGEFVCQSCFLVKHPSQLADSKRQWCRDCV
jgi:hypothetical protein